MRFGLALVFTIVVACSGSSEVQHSVRCSEGPAQYGDATFPPPRDPSANGASLPECIPLCGGAKISSPPYIPAYPIEQLPSGSCEFDGDRCRVTGGTTQTCGIDTKLCNNSEFEGFCEDDQWRCYVTSQGAGLCAPCP